MRRWLLRSLALLSLVPFLLVFTVWASTRLGQHVLVRADASGDATLIHADVSAVTLYLATGWPREQSLTWEEDGHKAVFMARFQRRTLGDPIAGVRWGEGRMEIHTPVGEVGGELLLPPRWGSYVAAVGPTTMVTTGYALPLAVTAVPPLLWLPRWSLRRVRAARRRRAGQCLACGYDVRVAGGGRCPECGADVAF